jgi:hypothetical protein
MGHIYADDVYNLRDDINTMKKHIKALTNASKKVGLEVNIEKSECIFMSRYQNAKQNYKLKTGNSSLKNVAKLKYSGTKL